MLDRLLLAAVLAAPTGSTPTPIATTSHTAPAAASRDQQRTLDPHQLAQALTSTRWPGQYPCLDRLWWRESRWDPAAHNPVSTAYGIAQVLNETSPDPATQVRHGIAYIAARYPTGPCAALAHSDRTGWY